MQFCVAELCNLLEASHDPADVFRQMRAGQLGDVIGQAVKGVGHAAVDAGKRIAGSLRKASYSSAVLSSLRDLIAAVATLEVRDLRLPLNSEDGDGMATPENVRDFRQSIGASDGVVIVTPEYNHGIPGVLKNALVWPSRPFGKSVLIGKPVLIMSVSQAFTGGVHAHAQVNETLLAIQARIVPGPQIVIGSVAEKIRDGILVDESCQRFALAALDRLTEMSRSLEGSLRAQNTMCSGLSEADRSWRLTDEEAKRRRLVS